MIKRYSNSSKYHIQALENLNSANAENIKSQIRAGLDEKALLSARQFNNFKDLYIQQIRDDIRIGREEITRKIDQIKVTISSLFASPD